MPETRKLRNSPWAGDVLESLGKGTEVKKLAFIDDGYPPDRDGDLRRWFYVQVTQSDGRAIKGWISSLDLPP